MLGVEYCITVFYALQIICMHNKDQGNMTPEEIIDWKNKKQARIRNLVTMETIEVLIPLAYSMSYGVAFYGPNARYMEKVKNTYWGNTEQDINAVFKSVFRMAGLDACGAILIGVVLGLVCQINTFEEICIIMKKHWITLSLVMGRCLFFVSNIV